MVKNYDAQDDYSAKAKQGPKISKAGGIGGLGGKGGKKSKHTGRIRHSDMHSLMDGHGGKDPLAHSSHHANNSAFGTSAGMSPQGDYDGGGADDGCGEPIGDNTSFE